MLPDNPITLSRRAAWALITAGDGRCPAHPRAFPAVFLPDGAFANAGTVRLRCVQLVARNRPNAHLCRWTLSKDRPDWPATSGD